LYSSILSFAFLLHWCFPGLYGGILIVLKRNFTSRTLIYDRKKSSHERANQKSGSPINGQNKGKSLDDVGEYVDFEDIDNEKNQQKNNNNKKEKH